MGRGHVALSEGGGRKHETRGVVWLPQCEEGSICIKCHFGEDKTSHQNWSPLLKVPEKRSNINSKQMEGNKEPKPVKQETETVKEVNLNKRLVLRRD